MDAVTFLQEQTKGLFPEALGLCFLEAAPERVKASMVVRPDLCTTNHVLHGGAIMAFADTLGAYATALNIDLAKGVGTTTLERSGASLYCSWATHETREDARKALSAAAIREEENAVLLEEAIPRK